MCNPRLQQRVLAQDCGIPLPRHPSPACAATQLFPPNATDPPIKLPKASVVRRSPVVLVVAAELGVKGLLLLVHRIVPVRLTPLGDLLQPPTESLADRPHVYCELPLSAACADVREAEEIERGPDNPIARTPTGPSAKVAKGGRFCRALPLRFAGSLRSLS
jgi:hypothetical protein